MHQLAEIHYDGLTVNEVRQMQGFACIKSGKAALAYRYTTPKEGRDFT